MKFKHYITFFIILTSVFLGCENNNSGLVEDNIIAPPTDTLPPVIIPDTLGDVMGIISSADGPVEGALVILNNRSVFSNDTGFYEFKDCIKKSSNITVTHPDFSKYHNIITNITDTVILNINLTRIRYDYYPLKVGNHWQYHYVYSWYTNFDGTHRVAGKLDWEITDKYGDSLHWNFQVKETFYDSSFNTNTESYFEIETFDSDSILFVDNTYLEGLIRRYYTPDSPEIVSSSNGVANYYFQRNIGFIHLDDCLGGISIGYCKILDLINYQLH